MGNIITPSTKMLPMEDIKNELIQRYSFTTSNDNATDTNSVADVDAKLIAVSAGLYKDGTPVQFDGSGKIINPDNVDRAVVPNSTKLGGKTASEYITKQEATSIQNFGENVSEIFANELASLRDEVYQMKGELSKQGLLKDFTLYQGFQDYFRVSDVKYMKDPVCGILQNSLGTAGNVNVNTLYPAAPTEFNIGDYFVIYKKIDDSNSMRPSSTIVRVTAKNNTLGEITFSPSTTDLYVDNIELYKSLGQYTKGSFSFSNTVANSVIDNKEMFTMLNDDTSTIALTIKSNKAGYAAKFKVPDGAVGALSKLSIKARAVGSPGALICYAIEGNATATLRTIEEATNDGSLLCQSKPIQASSARVTSMIDFEFSKADGTPVLLGANQYGFVIEAQYASAVDYWEITFCRYSGPAGGGTDLQRNNISYIYKEVTDTDLNSRALDSVGVVPDTGLGIVNYDLLFIMATKQVALENESPFVKGLYTSKKIALAAPIEISKARLTLRINREGCYNVSSQTGIYGNSGTLSIAPEVGAGSYPMNYGNGITSNDIIVVGKDIREVESASTFQIKLKKGAYVDKFDPLYKIGYKVYLRYNCVEWDADTCTFKTKYASNDATHPGGPQIELPLIAVMPDGVKAAPNYSERLVFEGNTLKESDVSIYANQFELQVVWDSGFQYENLDSFKELIGRIFDMTLSFDKSL